MTSKRQQEIDELIQSTIKITVKELHGSAEDIAENAVRKVLKDSKFKSCPLPFKTPEEEEEFKVAVPELMDLSKKLDNAKSGAKKVFWIMLTLVIANMYDDIINVFQRIMEFISTTPTK